MLHNVVKSSQRQLPCLHQKQQEKYEEFLTKLQATGSEPDMLRDTMQRSLDVSFPPLQCQDVPQFQGEHKCEIQMATPGTSTISYATPYRISTDMQPTLNMKTDPTAVPLDPHITEDDRVI